MQGVDKLHSHGVYPAAVKKHSIRLYLLCATLEGLFYLEEMYSSGELKVFLGSLFCILLNNKRCVSVRTFVWERFNYMECTQHLCSLSGLGLYEEMYKLSQCVIDVRADSMSKYQSMRVDLLPNELFEMLLIKAANQLFISFIKLTEKVDVYSLISLSAVSDRWRQIFNRRFILRLLQRQFSRVCHPFKCHPQQLSSLHFNQPVCGIAEFNNKLFLAFETSSVIQVFHSSPPFSRLTDIEVNGVVRPIDIVVCSETSQLYIADFELCAIWRVNLLSYKQVDKFISTQWKPRTLSTKSRRLLITPDEGDALFVYGDDGTCLIETHSTF